MFFCMFEEQRHSNDYLSCGLSGKTETKNGWMDNVNVVDERLGFVFPWCDGFHSNKPCAFRATRRPTSSQTVVLGRSIYKAETWFWERLTCFERKCVIQEKTRGRYVMNNNCNDERFGTTVGLSKKTSLFEDPDLTRIVEQATIRSFAMV